MAYGFRIPDVNIPKVRGTLHVNMSDPDKQYVLEGSASEGFVGDGASATYKETYSGEPADIYNGDVAFVTSDAPPMINVPQGVIDDINTNIFSKLGDIAVVINGQDAELGGDQGWVAEIEDPQAGVVTAYVFPNVGDYMRLSGFIFGAIDGEFNDAPGTYSVEIKYPGVETSIDIKIDEFSEDDTGDVYSVTIGGSFATDDFVSASEDAIKSSKYPMDDSLTTLYDDVVTLPSNNEIFNEGPAYLKIPLDFSLKNRNEVTIDGVPLSWSTEQYDAVYDNEYYAVWPGENGLFMCVFDNEHRLDNEYIISGDYRLKIRTPGEVVNPHFESGVEKVLSNYGLVTPADVKFDGILSLTSSDNTGVHIPFPVVDITDYESWHVTLNGINLPYSSFETTFTYEDTVNNIFYSVGNYGEGWVMNVVDTSSWDPIPGDYALKIEIPAQVNAGGNMLIVNVTYDDGGGAGTRAASEGGYVSDVSYEDVSAAINAGKAVFVHLVDYGLDIILPYAYHYEGR